MFIMSLMTDFFWQNHLTNVLWKAVTFHFLRKQLDDFRKRDSSCMRRCNKIIIFPDFANMAVLQPTNFRRFCWEKSYKYVFSFYVSGQMFLLDRFFDGTFFTYGIEVMSFADRDQEDRIDPMIYVFPRMTKCTFHKFGTSGNIEKHDALCILPLNIVNEKIYIFIWFWLLLLGALSFLVLVYRVVIIFSPYIRAFVLRLRYRRVKRECIGKVLTHLSNQWKIHNDFHYFRNGHWQILRW